MGLCLSASFLLAMGPAAAAPAPPIQVPTPAPVEASVVVPPAPQEPAPASPPDVAPPASESAAPSESAAASESAAPTPAPVEPAVAPVAPVAAPSAAPFEPSHAAPPAPVAHTAPPPRGIGLFIGSAALGITGFVYRVGGTVRAVREVRDPASCTFGGDCAIGSLLGGAVVGTPLLLVSAALLGGGMGLRGQLRAHEELFHDLPAHRKPSGRMPLRGVLGWSLLGGGAALWASSRVPFFFLCENDACRVAGWETTYYLSGALLLSGMVLGPYATAYRRYKERFGPEATVSLVPTLSRDYGGLSLSGRF